MPIIIRCKRCGAIYHYGSKPVSIDIFLKSLSRCRQCGSKLSNNINEVSIDVRVIEEKE